jgi:translation initiation factor 3 subunit A
MAANAFFHKPELALRRAVELENISQDDAALSLLHEILSSRRHRTWSPAYESIMIKYVDLCLKLRRSRECKDGLHQYRNLTQQTAPGSLEKVILYLMDLAEKECDAAKAFVDAESLLAQQQQNSNNTDSQDDEDFGVSPQSILLTTMSTDPAKSQRDSTLLLPSLKFLWETYRAVLDILRSNSKLEHVYHKAAQNALKFCRVYKRRMEFRHLCEMLRLHLSSLRQYGVGDATAEDFKANNKVRKRRKERQTDRWKEKYGYSMIVCLVTGSSHDTSHIMYLFFLLLSLPTVDSRMGRMVYRVN